MRQIKCNKCGHIGPEEDFPKGRDFFQKEYIAGCPKCDNRQSPGGASMRMFGDAHPFEFVRPPLPENLAAIPVIKVMRDAGEAS